MTIFNYGFEKMGFRFGWFKKELYRLPSEINSRYYSLKKLNLIKIGKQKGYRICTKKLTISQLEKTTNLFSEPIKINNFKHEDLPF